MDKLPGTTLIPVYQVGGICYTHDESEAFEIFKEFISHCMNSEHEFTPETLRRPEQFSITVEAIAVDFYLSSNRYNISKKQLEELKSKYDLNAQILADVENGVM